MTHLVYMICGVPGSGKTWVCKQLTEKFCYVPHDDYLKNLPAVIKELSQSVQRPIITECPFGERLLRESLNAYGLVVFPLFIVEHPEVVYQRYFARNGKAIGQAALTRASTIKARAIEWQATYGTSEEILQLLLAAPASGLVSSMVSK